MESITLDWMTQEAQQEYQKVYKYEDKDYIHSFIHYKMKGITVSDEEANIINEVKDIFSHRRINIYDIQIKQHKDVLAVWINGEEVDPEYGSGDYSIKLMKEAVDKYENIALSNTSYGSFSVVIWIIR